MGLFSSKYETNVGASVSRVISDERLPDAIKTGTIKSLLRNEDQADHILEELVNGLALKANRMYTYGGSTYTNGLPSGEIVTNNQGQDALQAVLDTLEGTPVLLEYSHFGPPNNLHIAWTKLITQYGYDPSTNQLGVLSAQEGVPVYLHDMVIRIPADTLAITDQTALAQWGTSPKAGQSPTRPAWTADYKWMTLHTPVEIPLGAGDPYAVVFWTKTVPGDYYGMFVAATPAEVNIPLDGFDDSADYFQAKYTVGGVTKYFTYRAGTGTYPTLDAFFNAGPEMLGEFFPIAHFRYNKAFLNVDKTTQEYLTSRKLVKYLGLKYDDIIDAIGENPDIADVEQAMLLMAVPAITTNKLEQRYLYEFFRRLYLVAPETYTSKAMMALRTVDVPKTNIVIKDNRFEFVLGNTGIIRRLVAGTLGPVGSYHSSTTVDNVPYVIRVPGAEGDYFEQPANQAVTSYLYRKQISNSVYDEVQVVGLSMTYQMGGEYYVVADATDKTLLVPLDSGLVRPMSLSHREELYARSMHFVFTSRVLVKVAWYQQFWFEAFITIVGAVIGFVTGGATFNAFMNSVLSGTLAFSTLLMTLLTTLIEYLVVSELTKLFVKAIGGDAALILVLALVAYGVVDAFRSGSLKGAPWASDLLKLSNTLTKGISEVVKEGFLDLQKEADAFGAFAKGAAKDMEAAQTLLQESNRLNPLILWGESPTDYYNRTVHSGNVGLLSIKAVSSYVTNSLKLPKLTETLGDDLEYQLRT